LMRIRISGSRPRADRITMARSFASPRTKGLSR
jgi:hypothetical protein